MDTNLWFPEKNGFRDPGYRTARSVCGTCPVRRACLDEELAFEGNRRAFDRQGMWGGLTPRDRERLAHEAVVA